jgi:hypothetical protein
MVFGSFADKLQKLILIEGKRYQKKGILNTIIASSLLFGMMYAALQIARNVWPKHIEDK